MTSCEQTDGPDKKIVKTYLFTAMRIQGMKRGGSHDLIPIWWQNDGNKDGLFKCNLNGFDIEQT